MNNQSPHQKKTENEYDEINDLTDNYDENEDYYYDPHDDYYIKDCYKLNVR